MYNMHLSFNKICLSPFVHYPELCQVCDVVRGFFTRGQFAVKKI